MRGLYAPGERIDAVVLSCDACDEVQGLRIVGERILCPSHRKACSRCRAIQPLDAFHRDATRSDGRFPQCKSCRKPYAATYLPRQREADRRRRQELWKNPHACGIDDCDKPTIERFCSMHTARISRHGDPTVVKEPARHYGPDHHNWSAQPSYSGVHWRLAREKGPAHLHRCTTCPEQAAEWAYDHTDPHELISSDASGLHSPYSTDLSTYVPLCVPCHRAFDGYVAQAGALDNPLGQWLSNLRDATSALADTEGSTR